MTPLDFASLCHAEKESHIASYFAKPNATLVGALIHAMGLLTEQLAVMRRVLDASLSDAYFGLLMGLDGCASIGDEQVVYRLLDEEGCELTGELGAVAGDLFKVDVSLPRPCKADAA